MDKSPMRPERTKNEDDTVSQSSENVDNELDQNSSPTKNYQNGKIRKSKSSLRHFPNLENERVLKRYNCALVSELILLQGNLYITDNYFAFYSNIFGYVTKLLIPILTIEDITKEKTAKFIPNAIGMSVGGQKHIFTSFLQRENSLKFLKQIWQESKNGLEGSSDFDSDSFYSSEEEIIPEKEVLDVDGVDSKRALVPQTAASSYRTKSIYMKLMWYSTVVIIVILFIMSAILFYRIVKIQQRYSSIVAGEGSFKRDPLLMKNIFRENPDLLTESYLSLNEFIDKNIQMVTNTRKSLESLTRLLDNKNEKEKT